MNIKTVMGLDLSSTAMGGIVMPTNWKGNLRRGRVFCAGHIPPGTTKREAARREEYMSDVEGWERRRRRLIVSVISQYFEREVIDPSTTLVCIEGAWVGPNAKTASELLMLRGAVLDALERFSVASIQTVQPSEWRRVLHGTAQGLRAAVKLETERVLNAAGAPPHWNEDQRDAMGVTNWAMFQLGHTFFSAPPRERIRPQRVRVP